MADLDGDGRPDLLSGSNCCDPYGFHVFFRRPDGTFGPGKRFEAAFDDPKADEERRTNFLMRGYSRVAVADWDRDGNPDLLFTRVWGRDLYVSLGPFDTTREQLGPFRRVPLDLPPETGFSCTPAVADWDRDGNPDLLVGVRSVPDRGGQSGIYWYRNLADKGGPRFAPPVRLLPEEEKGVYLVGISAADWDGSGWPALVVARLIRERIGKSASYHDTTWAEVYRRDVKGR